MRCWRELSRHRNRRHRFPRGTWTRWEGRRDRFLGRSRRTRHLAGNSSTQGVGSRSRRSSRNRGPRGRAGIRIVGIRDRLRREERSGRILLLTCR